MPLGDNQGFTDLLRASPTRVRMAPVVGRKLVTGGEENEAYCVVSSGRKSFIWDHQWGRKQLLEEVVSWNSYELPPVPHWGRSTNPSM